MNELKHGKPHESTCGAKTRNGGACKRPAGSGTDHPGQGRCKLHGGATPIKHGRYSSIQRPRVRDLLAQLDTDGTDPLDLEPELQLLRALVLDYIERYDAMTEALIDWHSSFGEGFQQAVQDWRHKLADWTELLDQSSEPAPPPPIPRAFEAKPRQVVDILSVGRFIAEIGAMTERIHKRRAEGSITLATLDRVLEQHGVELVNALQEVNVDASTREALLDNVERRWDSIRLDTVRPSSSRLAGSAAVN
jgi:hypothetical protein